MKKIAYPLCAALFLIVGYSIDALAKGEEYNKPIPMEALKLMQEAKHQRELDKYDAALTLLRKAIALAPNGVEIHVTYYETKSIFMIKARRPEPNMMLCELKSRRTRFT